MKAAVLLSVHHGINIGCMRKISVSILSLFFSGVFTSKSMSVTQCCAAQKPPIFLRVVLFLLTFYQLSYGKWWDVYVVHNVTFQRL